MPVLHPVESAWVAQVFAWYLTGEYSDAKITEKLNTAIHRLPDGQTLPVRHKGARGRTQPGKFSKDNIRGMLSRIFYTGKIPYYGKTQDGKSRKRRAPQAIYEGRQPAIINERDFQEVQDMRYLLGHNPRTRRTTPANVYPLTQRLHCAECGGGYRGTSVRRRRYYRNVMQVEHKGTCSQSNLIADEVEREVFETLVAL
ncbi:MAG: hypothetical protein GY792_00010, partial [Gammaproteobacteria bacterium]|nr:hypothetical protein [Gammaproteobacteria bacterium]